MTTLKTQENRPVKNVLRFVLTKARLGKPPIVVMVTLVILWWLSVLLESIAKSFTGSLEEGGATLLIGLFATAPAIVYIALFLLIPGSLYIWAIRRIGRPLNDDQWNAPLSIKARILLAIRFAAAILLSYALFGHLFEVLGEYDSYTSFFSTPVQFYYERRAVFPILAAMVIALPFCVYLYKRAKRGQCAEPRGAGVRD